MTDGSPACTIDLLAIGRISLDLFSLAVGAPFERIPGFDARVGGSPSNVAFSASRLGCSDTMPYLAEVEVFLECHP